MVTALTLSLQLTHFLTLGAGSILRACLLMSVCSSPDGHEGGLCVAAETLWAK